MKVDVLAVALGFLSLAWASKDNCTWDEIQPSKELKWCPCLDGFFCAKLDVPLDYHDKNAGRAAIALLKYPAQANSTDGPYQGQILLNPGGPGGGGVEYAQYYGANYSVTFGSNWDWVGFDPRGMFNTLPALNCSVPFSTTSLSRRDVPHLGNAFYQKYYDFGQRLGPHCQQVGGADNQAGPHMSTAVVARDMASITDAFAASGDGKRAERGCLTNYYGVSYGTMIGQTFASMFPEKVGIFVIDGVVNPAVYLRDFSTGVLQHLDAIFGSYFIYCMKAGTTKCPYSAGSASPKALFNRFKSAFSQLDPQKAQTQHWKNATLIEDALYLLKIGVLNALYSPLDSFGNFSTTFLSLESALKAQDLRPFLTTVNQTLHDQTDYLFTNFEYTAGVLCPDEGDRWYGKSIADFQPTIDELERESIFGETWIRNTLPCAGWSIKAKEIFSGPFGANKTATPILFVSNTNDAVTPIEDSRQYAPKFKDAQLLTIDGTGHTSDATGSQCANSKLRAYFQKAQLPGKDAYCPLEKGPFDVQLQGTLKDNLAQAGLSDLHY